MSKYRRKRVLFICIGNACRSPMAEAIARVDAYDAIDAFSAGLAPIGFVTELTKQTLIRNGCWVEDLESTSISPKVWEQVDIVINMSGHPREVAFDDYSKVEDWKIEDPYGKDPETHQRVFEEIRLRIAKLAQECREQLARESGEEDAPVQFKERRARGRWYPTSPVLINLDGGNDASVLNISEEGLALSAATILSNLPLQNLQVQFLESPHPLEAGCRIAWKSESEKEMGIQFVGLTEEGRDHIRNWISAHATPNNLPGQSGGLFEKQKPRTAVSNALHSQNAVPGASASATVMDRQGKAPVSSPAAVPSVGRADTPLRPPRTNARAGIRPNRNAFRPAWRFPIGPGSLGVLRRRWGTLLILVSLVGLISWTVQSVTLQRNQHTDRSEVTTTLAQKPAAPRPVTTTPGVPNPQASNTQAPASYVKPLPFEEVDNIVNSYQDISPKRSPKATNVAKKSSPGITVKTPNPRVEKILTSSRSTNASPRVPATASISPAGKTQPQASSSPAPALPQLAMNIAQPAPLPSKDVRPPEPESKASSIPAEKPPAAPANITGAVAILADPYPSLRIGSGSSKKQRQGTSLQLGHLLSRIEPAYPDDAKQQGIQGTVKLHAIIDRHGSIQSLQPVNGPPPLVAAAMNAVRQWRFSETLLAGQSVETEEDIDIVFRLSNAGTPKK
jgi:TonB family protein